MTKYIYRVLHRHKSEHWPQHLDPAKNIWCVLNNRSYNTLPTAQGVMTNHERQNTTGGHWEKHPTRDGDYWQTHPIYEYKLQRFPMTQEWQDIHG